MSSEKPSDDALAVARQLFPSYEPDGSLVYAKARVIDYAIYVRENRLRADIAFAWDVVLEVLQAADEARDDVIRKALYRIHKQKGA